MLLQSSNVNPSIQICYTTQNESHLSTAKAMPPIILISDAAMPQLIASFPINSTIVWTEGSPLYSTLWKLGGPHTPLIATSPLIHSTLGVFSFYCFNLVFAFLPAIWYTILNATCVRLVTSTCMCRSTPATTT